MKINQHLITLPTVTSKQPTLRVTAIAAATAALAMATASAQMTPTQPAPAPATPAMPPRPATPATQPAGANDAVFKRVDADRDGFISKAELGNADANLARDFDKYDSDKDGRLSVIEFDAMMKALRS